MSLKRFTFLLGCLLIIPLLYAGEIRYPVSAIPSALIPGASTVIRYENHEFEVVSQVDAVERITIAVTYLTDKSIQDSRFYLPYDKYSKIRQVRAIVYDAEGVVANKVSGEEILDISGIDGYTLYADHRIKVIDPGYRTIPFTVEYSWETVYSGMINGPEWSPYKDAGSSIETSRFRLIWPDGVKMRFLEQNYPYSHTDSTSEGKRIRTWNATGLNPYREEPYGPPESDIVPTIYTAPSEFEIGGYAGNMESWNNFGNWILTLNEGKDLLGPETQNLVKKMVSDQPDMLSRAKRVYEYFQNRTRYVNISVGMGGWQTIPAEEVDRICYGDCKALSNYLRALLSAAGVSSTYALVRAGKDAPELKTGFPSNQFNHAILCIPGALDSLWLECTSQYIPFGYLGSFTDDRDALLITPAGGKLVRTPELTSADNTKGTMSTVSFDMGLYATADIRIWYGGIFYDEMVPVIHSDAADREEIVTEMIGIPQFELVSFSLTELPAGKPKVHEILHLNLDNYCSMLGGKILLPLNLVSRTRDKLVNPGTRKTEILVRRATRVIDTVVYMLPSGIIIESIPKDTTLRSPFGTFSMSVNANNNRITYIRTLEMNKGKYPVSSAKEFSTFFLAVHRFDNSKCILRKKE